MDCLKMMRDIPNKIRMVIKYNVCFILSQYLGIVFDINKIPPK